MPFRIRISLILLAVMIGAIVFLPLVWPVPTLEGLAPARVVAGPEATWIEVPNVALHARIEGPVDETDAVGVVFLHGFGSNLVSFAVVQDALSVDRRTVAYDRPGFGLTERVLEWEGDNPYAPDTQVDHVIEAMDAAGIERAVLMGHSAGGPIAMEAALAHADRVAGLILIGPAVYRGGGAPAWSRFLLSTPQLERIGPLLMRQLGGAPGENLLQSSYADPSRLQPDVQAAYRQATTVEDWDRALWELVKASRATTIGERLDALTLPILVATGAQDVIVPAEESRRLADELPNATLLELDDCGHQPQEECAEPFLEGIDAWWGSVTLP